MQQQRQKEKSARLEEPAGADLSAEATACNELQQVAEGNDVPQDGTGGSASSSSGGILLAPRTEALDPGAHSPSDSASEGEGAAQPE